MNTKSPEVQFEINFSRDLNGIFKDHKKEPDLKVIKDRLAASVVKEYNDYFKHLGIDGVVFVYNEETGKIIAPNLAAITNHKEEVIKGLRGMGIIKGVKKEDVLQIIEGAEKSIKEWEDDVNNMIDIDAKAILNRLKDKESIKQLSKQINDSIAKETKDIQRRIDELNSAYAAKRNEYLLSIAQILLAVALIVTVAVLVSMAILPISAAAAIPSTVIFALYEFKNISKGLNNGLERKDAYEAWQKAKEDKDTIVNNIADDKVREYLKANTTFIGKDAKIDEKFEKVMLGIKRSKELHNNPPHKTTTPQNPVVKKHAYTEDVHSGQIELAGEKFRKYVREALLGIASEKSGRAKQDVIKDALKAIFVDAHNEYFASINLKELRLVIDERTKLVSLSNFDKNNLNAAIDGLDFNTHTKKQLMESFEEIEKGLKNLDNTLSEYAIELAEAVNNTSKDKTKIDKGIDTCVKEMETLRNKLHGSYIKITLAILLVVGMSVATFTGVIPMVALTGAICTSTLFIANALESVFENSSKVSDLKLKIDNAKKEDLKQGAEVLGIDESVFNSLKIGKHDQSPVNQAILNLVQLYPKEMPGPSRTA